jgi:hypothetical protein
MSTHPLTRQAPRRSRVWAGLRAVGRHVVDNLATDNGWLWAWGMGCPYPFPGPYPSSRYSGRADDQQP